MIPLIRAAAALSSCDRVLHQARQTCHRPGLNSDHILLSKARNVDVVLCLHLISAPARKLLVGLVVVRSVIYAVLQLSLAGWALATLTTWSGQRSIYAFGEKKQNLFLVMDSQYHIML